MLFLSELRHAFRALGKDWSIVAIAVLAFGLGIGANTAVFSIADAFLLRPLPIRGVDRMAAVMETRAGQAEDWSGAAPANFLDWKRQARAFDGLALALDGAEKVTEALPKLVCRCCKLLIPG
jgi:putative ABC transport system permease protein